MFMFFSDSLTLCRWWALLVWSLTAPTTGWCCVCCGAPSPSPSCCPCSSGLVTVTGQTSAWCGRSAWPSCPMTTWMRVSCCWVPSSQPRLLFPLVLHLMIWTQKWVPRTAQSGFLRVCKCFLNSFVFLPKIKLQLICLQIIWYSVEFLTIGIANIYH